MTVNIVKRDRWRIPRSFISQWFEQLAEEISSKHRIDASEIVVVFVPKKEIKKINNQFRKKNKATDILSFEGFEPGHLGELVLCGDIVSQQAKEHGLLVNEELGYLLIHGLLHLLGYEHEKGGPAEKKMFALQDKIFAKMQSQFFERVPT